MVAAKPNELVPLIERKFEDPEDEIASLERALAVEAKLQDWPLPEDRHVRTTGTTSAIMDGAFRAAWLNRRWLTGARRIYFWSNLS
jgi:hypothetical protein